MDRFAVLRDLRSCSHKPDNQESRVGIDLSHLCVKAAQHGALVLRHRHTTRPGPGVWLAIVPAEKASADFLDSLKKATGKARDIVKDEKDTVLGSRNVAREAADFKQSVLYADSYTPSQQEASLLQRSLGQLGLSVGNPDGLIGEQTRNGIRVYQSMCALPADGIMSFDLVQDIVSVAQRSNQVKATLPVKICVKSSLLHENRPEQAMSVRTRRLSISLLSAVLMTLVSACGGGGGGDSEPPTTDLSNGGNPAIVPNEDDSQPEPSSEQENTDSTIGVPVSDSDITDAPESDPLVIKDEERIAMSFRAGSPPRRWSCLAIYTAEYFGLELASQPISAGASTGTLFFIQPHAELGAITTDDSSEFYTSQVVMSQREADEAVLNFPTASAQDIWTHFSFFHTTGERSIQFDSDTFGQVLCVDPEPPELPVVAAPEDPVDNSDFEPVDQDPTDDNEPVVTPNPDLEYDGEIYWEFTHSCSTVITPGLRVLEIPIEIRFFEFLNDERTGKTWPDDADRVYSLDSPSWTAETRGISTFCAYPTKVCFGASVTTERDETYIWGAGLDGSNGCSDCCRYCPNYGGTKIVPRKRLLCG